MEPRNKDGLTEAEFLANYKPGNYERPSVTVDMLILGMNKELDGLKLLLIQRKNHPFINKWALAGGFVNMDESADVAASRELEEETGLKNVYMEQLYTMSEPGRDPRMRVIDIAYMALMPVAKVKAGDDAKDAVWFDITFDDKNIYLKNEEKNIHIHYSVKNKIAKNGVVKVNKPVPLLESEEALAFDHAEIVLDGLLRLRNKVEYSDIAFNLVPKKFTLPDLQRVYEIILGKQLYKTNFRAKVEEKIEKLEEKSLSITGNKRCNLYKYKG